MEGLSSHLGAEGPQADERQLDVLDAERDPDDGEAESDAGRSLSCKHDEPQRQPEDVADGLGSNREGGGGRKGGRGGTSELHQVSCALLCSPGELLCERIGETLGCRVPPYLRTAASGTGTLKVLSEGEEHEAGDLRCVCDSSQDIGEE